MIYAWKSLNDLNYLKQIIQILISYVKTLSLMYLLAILFQLMFDHRSCSPLKIKGCCSSNQKVTGISKNVWLVAYKAYLRYKRFDTIFRLKMFFEKKQGPLKLLILLKRSTNSRGRNCSNSQPTQAVGTAQAV